MTQLANQNLRELKGNLPPDKYYDPISETLDQLIALGTKPDGRINIDHLDLRQARELAFSVENAAKEINGHIIEKQRKVSREEVAKDWEVVKEFWKIASDLNIASGHIVTLLAYKAGENPYDYVRVLPFAHQIEKRLGMDEENAKIQNLVEMLSGFGKPCYSESRHHETGYYYNPGNYELPKSPLADEITKLVDSNEAPGFNDVAKDEKKRANLISKLTKELESLGFDPDQSRFVGAGAEQAVFAVRHKSGDYFRIVLKMIYEESAAKIPPCPAPQILPVIVSRDLEVDGQALRMDLQPMICVASLPKGGTDYQQVEEMMKLGLIAYNRFHELYYGENPHLAYFDTGQDFGLGPCRNGGKLVTPLFLDQGCIASDKKLYDRMLEGMIEDKAASFPNHLKWILEEQNPLKLLNPFEGVDWYRHPTGRAEGHATIVESIPLPEVLQREVDRASGQPSTTIRSPIRLSQAFTHVGKYGSPAIDFSRAS